MSENEMLEELKKIRKHLEPPPPPPPPKNLYEEFKQFLSKYKVIGLAVAFIMGIYLGNLVKSLVDNLVMPIVSLFVPGIEWEAITIGVFRIGAFLGDLITFVIVAFVIFLLVKLTSRLNLE
ncbi:MAG: Large-conductance mechanosensitive ion channel [Promethearchaeota archaeon]|nr:MAG: Large-conductance mechanosensitive ion channel [Candidatus Lokiarchaeota archaeon]